MPRSKSKYNERIELGTDPSGKRIRKWVRADTKAEFEAKKYELRKEWEQIRNPSAVTFGNYAQQWFDVYKGNKSVQTQNMYSNILAKLKPLDRVQLRSVTSTDLQKIINADWDHPRTCELLKLTMKQILKQAVRDGIVAINNAEDLELPKKAVKETRFISDDEMEKILQIEFKPQDRLYIDVLRNTGMRPSEALALRWEDIHEDYVHVCRAFEFKNNKPQIKSTKTEVERDIPLNQYMRSVLISDGKNEGFVFRKEDGEPFTLSAYNKMYKRIIGAISEKLGVQDVVMYSFRHTFATFLYYHGCRTGIISTKKAAQILGHSEQVFLRRYTHIDDSKESVAEIIEQISPVTCPKLDQETEN